MKLKDEDLNFIDKNEEQIKVYVGEKADKYIKLWKEGNKFNLPAFLLGTIWLGYRGMYRNIMCVMIIMILKDICAFFIEIDLRFLGIALPIFLGIIGNYLYFLQVKKDILAGKEKCLDGVAGIFLSLIILAGYCAIRYYVF